MFSKSDETEPFLAILILTPAAVKQIHVRGMAKLRWGLWTNTAELRSVAARVPPYYTAC